MATPGRLRGSRRRRRKPSSACMATPASAPIGSTSCRASRHSPAFVAPDMPGFGDAAKPDGFDYSVPGYTRHLTALLQRLGVRARASRAARLRRRLGTELGAGKPGQAREPDAGQRRRAAGLSLARDGAGVAHARSGRIVDGWRSRTPALPPRSTRTSRASCRRAFIDGMYAHFRQGDPARGAAALSRHRRHGRLLFAGRGETFRSWSCPVCVVWGARDPFIDAKYAAAAARVLPGRRDPPVRGQRALSARRQPRAVRRGRSPVPAPGLRGADVTTASDVRKDRMSRLLSLPLRPHAPPCCATCDGRWA